jgi:hypothetical protein
MQVLPVFRIREILARIRIIGSVPEKTDMDTYKCLWIFDIKVIILVVLKCNKIQKCILPCENFNFVKKGVGIFFHVLHVYYSFHQKCSKLDTFTA